PVPDLPVPVVPVESQRVAGTTLVFVDDRQHGGARGARRNEGRESRRETLRKLFAVELMATVTVELNRSLELEPLCPAISSLVRGVQIGKGKGRAAGLERKAVRQVYCVIELDPPGLPSSSVLRRGEFWMLGLSERVHRGCHGRRGSARVEVLRQVAMASRA